MTKWLLSLIGVVFLGVLFDVIYPNGKTNAFCKGLFGIFTIYIIVSPIINFKLDINNDNNFVDTALVENINNAKVQAMEIKINNVLKDNGISNVYVEIDCDLSNSEFIVENITIDISNLVLDDGLMNINIYEVITNNVVSITGIDKDRIIIYG